MIKKPLATAFCNKELGNFSHSTLQLVAVLSSIRIHSSHWFILSTWLNILVGGILRWPPTYLPPGQYTLSSWMWVGPMNMVGYHSHDYLTYLIYGKGFLQKYLRSPVSWLSVHQQGDAPEWARPNQVMLLKRPWDTLLEKKNKSPLVPWVPQRISTNNLINLGEASKPKMTAAPANTLIVRP